MRVAGRISPHSLEAEIAVLGSLILDEAAQEALTPLLCEEAFYHQGHGKIWAAAQAVITRGQPLDLVTLLEELRVRGELEAVGGPTYLASLTETLSTAAYAEHYGRIVHDLWRKRQVIEKFGDLVRSAYEEALEWPELLSRAESELTDLARQRSQRGPDDYYREALEMLDGKGRLPTGFYDLDRFTGGLTIGDLNIIAAVPSMGKSSMARQIVRHHVKRLGSTFYLSIDQRAGEVYQLEACSIAKMSSDALREGAATRQEVERVREALAWVREQWGRYVRLIDEPLNIAETLSQARAAIRKGASLVVIDYLQLIESEGNTRAEEVSEVSRALKNLGARHHVTVLALSQVNQKVIEARPKDKRPLLSDLRESGQLAQDGHQVWMLYRDDYYNPASKIPGVCEVLVRKNKGGPTGKRLLTWRPHLTEFGNYGGMQ